MLDKNYLYPHYVDKYHIYHILSLSQFFALSLSPSLSLSLKSTRFRIGTPRHDDSAGNISEKLIISGVDISFAF